MTDATSRSDQGRPPPGPGETSGGRSRWKAAAAAVLLLLAGAALGVTVDRLWIARAGDARAGPLTADAMARSLELDPATRARVAAVLDSLRGEVAAAAAAGPGSLRAAARRARQRLHDVLPPDRRPAFRRWMKSRHREMMERMHSGEGPGAGGRHMPMHRRDSAGGMMMGPGGGPGGMMRGRDGGSAEPDARRGGGGGPGGGR